MHLSWQNIGVFMHMRQMYYQELLNKKWLIGLISLWFLVELMFYEKCSILSFGQPATNTILLSPLKITFCQ